MSADSEELAIEDLARSGINPEAAEEAGMLSVDDASNIYEDFQKLPALLIPYYNPLTGEPLTFERDGQEMPFARVRYLKTPKQPKGLKKRKVIRYSQPLDSGIQIYFPTVDGIDWKDVFDDVETPIVITEGEKKALRSCMAGIPTIGLGGVFNFMSGDNLAFPLSDLNLSGRTVYICFDSDAASNSNIQAAEGRLATELSLKRGADVFLGRLPAVKGSDKVGIDDYIVVKGEDAFFNVLEKAPQMRKIDAAVLGLNMSVAWIEREGLVYDTEDGAFIKKSDFVKGSRFSALEVIVPAKKGSGVKRVSVADEWLTHPHARRYQEVLFNPDSTEESITTEEGGTALNLWRGWSAEEGDVEPFLELTEFLFQQLPEESRSLPLKLMAYKAQNPGAKVPLALVLIGTQGSGKSLWAKIIREAFSPYGAAIPSAALLSDFNGWVEKSLVGVIDEAQAVHVGKSNDVLKNLISDSRQLLNEKYRAARQVDSFTMYIMTSNDRRVGAYAADDRRMVVISTPRKREDEFYDRLLKWERENGPKKLLHWLLNYDLKGWIPPKTAPMTAEKYMSYMESLTPIQRLAEDMKTASENLVKMWIDQSMHWAKETLLSDNRKLVAQARDIETALSRMQIRPFYTPEELAIMFPALVEQLHGFRSNSTPSGEISRNLRDCGIPHLRCKDNPYGFRWKGALRQYLVVADQDDWDVELSQKDFERYMKSFPLYGTKHE